MLEGNNSGSYYVPAPQLSGTPYNLPNRSPSPLFKPFSPLSIHKPNGPSIINVDECKVNVLNPDCKGLDNALACLDDYLMGEDAAEYNEIDAIVPQDPFTIFSFPYNMNYFASAPASSFRLDQFNALVDETGALLNMGTAEHPKSVSGLEPGYFTDVNELLLNGTQNVVGLPARDEFVPYLADPTLIDWHASREMRSPWPLIVHQRPGQCEQCEILRQIVHTNGLQGTKLEIHGREGQNYHAVMQTRFWLNDGCPPTIEHQMVEFPVGNSDYVKQFLLQYSLLRKKEGFLLQQDSLAPFANAGFQMSSEELTTAALEFNCFAKEEAYPCMYFTSFFQCLLFLITKLSRIHRLLECWS